MKDRELLFCANIREKKNGKKPACSILVFWVNQKRGTQKTIAKHICFFPLVLSSKVKRREVLIDENWQVRSKQSMLWDFCCKKSFFKRRLDTFDGHLITLEISSNWGCKKDNEETIIMQKVILSTCH